MTKILCKETERWTKGIRRIEKNQIPYRMWIVKDILQKIPKYNFSASIGEFLKMMKPG